MEKRSAMVGAAIGALAAGSMLFAASPASASAASAEGVAWFYLEPNFGGTGYGVDKDQDFGSYGVPIESAINTTTNFNVCGSSSSNGGAHKIQYTFWHGPGAAWASIGAPFTKDNPFDTARVC